MIKLLDILKEVDYSLHVNSHNEFNVDKLEKYGGGTDALVMMRGEAQDISVQELTYQHINKIQILV